MAAAEHLLAVRGRGKLGSDPVRMLFEQVAGPTGADGAPGVFCCGLRVVSMDGSTTDVPDSGKNVAFRAAVEPVPGRRVPAGPVVAAAESGAGSLLGAANGLNRSAEQPLALDLLGCLGPRKRCSRTGVPVLVRRPRLPRHGRAD